MSKCKTKVKDVTIHGAFPKTYEKYAKAPVGPKKVIFLEMRTDHITNTFQPLYDILTTEYDLDVRCHFLRYSFAGGKEYFTRSLEFLKDAATASVIFVNDACNVISAVPIRKETTVIQLWHACGAFKRFGLSTAELKFGNSREQAKRFPSYKNLDYVTVSSPEVCWAYAEAMDLEDEREKIVPVGVARTDLFYRPETREHARQSLLRAMPGASEKKVLLYAPTFRGSPANAVLPDKLDLDAMYRSFSEEYVLLIKHHPFIREIHPIPEQYRSFAKDVTQEMTIEELLCVSDVCISDYSSLIFEYSLFEKPMLFYAYDLDDYFDWRGFYYDYESLTPGPVVNTMEALIDQLHHVEDLDLTPVKAFREKFMSACDGHASERILRLAFGDRLEQYKK
ncbi:MAG: CDP-glycerol glycerophosphotransferase family protein [Oscillospiraceae bacterium]|nr:CDP-glycerol glycerophosphotransferase family protein [Oscillospiraceae bacterium]